MTHIQDFRHTGSNGVLSVHRADRTGRTVIQIEENEFPARPKQSVVFTLLNEHRVLLAKVLLDEQVRADREPATSGVPVDQVEQIITQIAQHKSNSTSEKAQVAAQMMHRLTQLTDIAPETLTVLRFKVLVELLNMDPAKAAKQMAEG